jgi:hypothetical protein
VPKIGRVGYRGSALGVALTAWDIWRRIPPHQRKLLVSQARKHGPLLVSRAVGASRTVGSARKGRKLG